MLTSTDAPGASRPRASCRPFAVEVAHVLWLSSPFTRSTFTGPELHRFGHKGAQGGRLNLQVPRHVRLVVWPTQEIRPGTPDIRADPALLRTGW
ncbi:hypothetical protein E3T34_13240 [Cryobacterium sp. TMT1-62]|uniref:hypothetical protein n=1 Tax=Cryobacterium sp. TMT1-62 TaxID=1259240 RepID=UPI0010694930|nr:hypothetical protein [Cryobacterium sp. TMT1-62]TFD30461.1 hypothetical protein E3T34_13240 [Cryobacterium sp. TMT1-62]